MGKSRSNKNRQPSRKEARERKKLEDRAEDTFFDGLKPASKKVARAFSRAHRENARKLGAVSIPPRGKS